MKNFKDLKNEIKSLEGSLLIIGIFSDKIFNLLENNSKVPDVYYLNSNDTNKSSRTDESNLKGVANNIHIKEIHKYFKDGIDNIFCNFDEIKEHVPSFIRESLRVTKKNIYINFSSEKDYKMIEKKYSRYGIKCELSSFEDYHIAKIEANDIIVHFPKETYYYIIDNCEKLYNYMSENI